MRSRHKIIPTNIKGFWIWIGAVVPFHGMLCSETSFYSAFSFQQSSDRPGSAASLEGESVAWLQLHPAHHRIESKCDHGMKGAFIVQGWTDIKCGIGMLQNRSDIEPDLPCGSNTRRVTENISCTPDCDLAGVLQRMIKSKRVVYKDVTLSLVKVQTWNNHVGEVDGWCHCNLIWALLSLSYQRMGKRYRFMQATRRLYSNTSS